MALSDEEIVVRVRAEFDHKNFIKTVDDINKELTEGLTLKDGELTGEIAKQFRHKKGSGVYNRIVRNAVNQELFKQVYQRDPKSDVLKYVKSVPLTSDEQKMWGLSKTEENRKVKSYKQIYNE